MKTKWGKKLIVEGLPLRKFSRELMQEQTNQTPATRWEALKTLLTGNNPPGAGA